MEFKLFLGGNWVETCECKIYDDMNPATGELYARVCTAGENEVEQAIKLGRAAQPDWAGKSPADRQKVFLRAAEHMEENRGRYIDILVNESGSTYMKAFGEVAECVDILRAAGGECLRVDGGVVPADGGGQLSYYIKQPLGLVAGIGPFNYPLLLSLNKVALAVAAGNSFILKPASDTPLSGIIIAECFEAGGLPKGVLSVLPGSGSVVGNMLVTHPNIDMVTFTGSTEVGQSIAVAAAENFKRCTLEMGGKNPIIILKDCNIDEAVRIAAFGAYFHQGQICMAGARIIVEAEIYDEFCEKLKAKVSSLKMGNPQDEDTIIGPLINAKQCGIIVGQIADALGKGARLLTGGSHDGAFFEPTLLADVTPEMNVFYDESFGPLAGIVKAVDYEEALALCNDNTYGLSAALVTNDLRKALTLVPRIEAGMVHVNGATVMGSRRAPFGGIKHSGIGRENSGFSIDEFTEIKWITIDYKPPHYPV